MSNLESLNLDFSDEEINHAIRVPVVLLMDVSGSMKSLIPELNSALNQFIESVKANIVAAKSAEVSIVAFDYDVIVKQEFETIEKISNVPKLEARGGATFTGCALMKALKMCQERKEYYQDNGYDYYQPWLVLMTDGMPCAIDQHWLDQNKNGNEENIRVELDALQKSTRQIHQLVECKKLNFINIAIGEGADVNFLKSLHPGSVAFKFIAGTTDFSKFFEWLGKSLKDKANSQKGDKVKTSPLADAGLEIC